jgi:carbon dioxide concentrating mechanism protein CcmN
VEVIHGYGRDFRSFLSLFNNFMYLPSVQPFNHPEIYINGDVHIDPQAILAPGIILQAAPNSRIVIRAGACLGMGTVLNAYQGTIEIEAGAVLGSGVLIIGNCKIGANACIGTATTVLDTKIESMTMIPPGSLIGDGSRTFVESDSDSSLPTNEKEIEEVAPVADNVVVKPELETVANSEISPESKDSVVIGEVYINQLLLTLFPEGKNLRKPKN